MLCVLVQWLNRHSEVCPVQTSADLFSSLKNADEAHISPVSLLFLSLSQITFHCKKKKSLRK